MDLSGLATHPIVIAGGIGKVVFSDVDSFMTAAERVADGDTELGDHGPWRKLVDPFDDQMGRYRTGAVIKRYIDGRDAGLSKTEALDAASLAYKADYGPDLVSKAGDTTETVGVNLWAWSKQMSDGLIAPGQAYIEPGETSGGQKVEGDEVRENTAHNN